MPYDFLADLVVCLHLAFIVFVILGGLLALRWRWIPWVHLPAAAWGAATEMFGWICPLTPLENNLRQAAGGDGFDTGFVEHYIVPVIYPDELTRGVQLVLGVLLVAFNVSIYIVVWRRRRSKAAAAS